MKLFTTKLLDNYVKLMHVYLLTKFKKEKVLKKNKKSHTWNQTPEVSGFVKSLAISTRNYIVI